MLVWREETISEVRDQLVHTPVGDKGALADGPVCCRERLHPIECASAAERERVRAAIG